MDIVYILGTGSAWDNNELRYSLRSVAKHLKGFDRVIIVGGIPEFIIPNDARNGDNCIYRLTDPNIVWIGVPDEMAFTKERRIMEKVKFACQQTAISDNFLFMNDDMFLLSPIDLTNGFPNYYKGTLLNSAKKRLNDRYKRALMNCHTALFKSGAQNMFNFDTHAPIIYNKKLFLDVMGCYDWTKPRDGYVVKSLYANTLGLEGAFQPDCKIDEPMMPMRIWDKIVDREFFSVGDNGLTDHMKQILRELYPDPSPWEIN